MFERINTTYHDFHYSFQNNGGEYYVMDHKGEMAPILDTCQKEASLLRIKFDNGYEIGVAEGHMFMNSMGNGVFARDLKIGYKIATFHGNIKVISKKKMEGKLAYDISIPYPHWYTNEPEVGIIHHNTLYGLLTVKAYLQKFPDAVCVFYDSEFGAPQKYWKSAGIDTTRVVHIPIENIEDLKFDIVLKLKGENGKDGLKRGDHVIFFIDSLGNLASKKEVEDAINEKSVADMTRAKSIKSLLRIVMPILATKDLPMIVVNHLWNPLELYSSPKQGGGESVVYNPNSILYISKSKERDKDKTLTGHNFDIKIEKSRYVKEGSIIPVYVDFKKGLNKYTGLLELAEKTGDIKKIKVGTTNKYVPVFSDPETGEISDEEFEPLTPQEIEENKTFWPEIMYKRTTFKHNIKKLLQLSENNLIQDEDFVIEEPKKSRKK